MSEPVLCYVEGCWAFFTTQALKDQWGDDWEDSPYEHNAEPPYEWYEGRNVPRYEIVKVAFDGDLETPSSGHLNSPYSVEQINNKAVPWLKPWYWQSNWGKPVEVWAGTTLTDFKRLVAESGGEVYVAEKHHG